jgi:ribosomal protein L10
LEKAVNRSEKAEAIVELNQIFKDASLMVVTRQSGLSVQEVTDLRRKVRAAGASYKVTKNRLTLRALEGTAFKALGPMFTGPTAIAYSKDPVAAAKVIAAFAKDNEKLSIVGGALGGNTWTSLASRLSPRCRPSMRCAARSSAFCRLRRPRSRAFCRRRPVRSLVCSAHTEPRKARRRRESSLRGHDQPSFLKFGISGDRNG